ncbi:MAG: efflux RND transporter periplasmic adaptor subunit [Proteobacteria bacterium]|nr:efflux RND transporter periplasmic adaptor subunit [Pseudomonadota bacterium]
MSHIADLVRNPDFEAAKKGFKPLNFLKKHPVLGGITAAAILGAGALAQGQDNSAPAAPPPAVVTVAAVAPQPVRVWSEFSGRLTAVNAAEIRPEVSGRITEIRFKDGQQVHAGDILMVIDPRPYEAAVAKAQADLAAADANAHLATLDLERARRLIEANAISRAYFDQRSNAAGVASANIKAAQATLIQARLDVDHAYVKAPIDGRVSRAEITVGNLVQAGVNAPLLTSVVANDSVYADFEVDEQTYLRSIHDHAASPGQEQRIPVQLVIQGDDKVYTGTIESFDNRIDTSTGTIRARARFTNSDGALVPGMFATVRLADAVSSKAILVPEGAIQNDQSKRFVYVVGRDGKADFREIVLGQEVGGRRIVTSGLKPGEKVIVDGVQRVQPGAVVEAHPQQFAAR